MLLEMCVISRKVISKKILVVKGKKSKVTKGKYKNALLIKETRASERKKRWIKMVRYEIIPWIFDGNMQMKETERMR